MTRLFVELYLDEDVSVLVANLVRAHGFIAITTQEAGMAGNDDPVQLAYAVSRHAAMLTHNRKHYEALATAYFAAGQMHFGIIVAPHRPSYELIDRLVPILNTLTADEMQNQLVYL